jgi:acyl dehydratase
VIDIDVRTLGDRIGQEIAVSDWREVTQAHIDQFAEATGDRQWIHIDPVRAATESPFRTTIAHGFLTLSLLSPLIRQSLQLGALRMAINYGLNRVRFVSPVPAGSRIRARITVQAVEAVSEGFQVTWQVTIDREQGGKPACVADWIVRYYPADGGALSA